MKGILKKNNFYKWYLIYFYFIFFHHKNKLALKLSSRGYFNLIGWLAIFERWINFKILWKEGRQN